MIRMSRILKDYQESGAANALISIHAAVNDHTFLTKGGDLVAILKVKGVDYECLDTGQLEEATRQLNATFRLLDENYRVYQYVVKREHAPMPAARYLNRIAQEVSDARKAFLETKADKLYVVDLYLVIAYEGWQPSTSERARYGSLLRDPVSGLRHSLSVGSRVNILNQSLDSVLASFSNRVDSLAVQLQDSFAVEVLSKNRAFTFLRTLLNYAPYKAQATGLRWNSHIDYQLVDSALECHRDHLKLDDYFVKVLTLKDPPARTPAYALRGVLEIPAEFVLVAEWHRESSASVQRMVRSKSRHFFNSKASLMNYAGGASNAPKDMLIDTGAEASVADLGACVRELETDGNYLGEFSLTAVLFDRDEVRLKRTVAEFFKVLGARDAGLTEERYNLMNAWLAALPGNRFFNLRRMWLTNTNYADLSLLFTLHPGEPNNQHLGTEYLATLETNHRTPFFLNLHHGDVGHTLVTGYTGSGKSFLLSFLLTNLQKYEPRTFIFDLGGSYEDLTRLFGGTYVQVGIEKRAFTINPFALPPTRENLQFLFSFVRVLVESADYRLTNQDERDLYEQIQNLYAVEPAQRRLLTLSNILSRNLRQALQKWVSGGPYGDLFDNADDSLTFATFQTFDFAGMDKLPQVLEPLLFYVLHRANAAIHNPALASTFKVFLMDEAWRFMKHTTTRNYIEEALKTWRKKNAAMILATQSSDDLIRSEMLALVAENCPTKIFLANPGMDRTAYREMFHLNETEANRIAELAPKKQMLLKRPDMSKVLNLNVDPRSYWIYTTNPYDQAKKREAFERHGFEEGLNTLTRSNPA